MFILIVFVLVSFFTLFTIFGAISIVVQAVKLFFGRKRGGE